MKKMIITEKKEGRDAIKRRSFVKVLGGGIVLLFAPWGMMDLMSLPQPQRRTLTKDYNAFLHIAEDGIISCYTGKMEMGQGVITSLAQMMADELNVPFEMVKMVMGDTDLCPYDQGTWGSLTTRAFGPAMRAAAAEARGVLVGMASGQLGVDASRLAVKDGVVFDKENPAVHVSYGKLAKGKRLERYLDVKPLPEAYTDFTISGIPMKQSNALDKVTGRAKYTGDLKLPGMLHARILRPPSHGARLLSADTSQAEAMKGVRVISDGDLIAVLSESRDLADFAIVRINAEYAFDEMDVSDSSLHEHFARGEYRSRQVQSAGDVASAAGRSTKLFEHRYYDPYLAHAPMEPHTALANWENNKLTVWASTQSPFGLQDTLAATFGLGYDSVRVITPLVGGAFGGKAPSQQGVEAARLSRLAGQPVMVAWTRDEEFFYDVFHPAGFITVKSAIDEKGHITLWDYDVYLSGTRGTEPLYDIPNIRITSHSEERSRFRAHPFDTGALRAPNNNTNTFARETQIDIMAAAAGTDPLTFRLQNLKNERLADTLSRVADEFGYRPEKRREGRGIGMACGFDAETWVAFMAEVTVDRERGIVKVERLACAQDMGFCVNPQGALLQMEGCLIMGLGYSLTEEVKFKGGDVLDRNFDSYDIPKFSWMPKLECIIMDRRSEPPQGGGEPAVIGVGAAIGNAIYDAVGARLFRMPFTPERVLEALKQGS